MVYKKNVPLVGDRLRISRVDFLNNFEALDDIFGEDHVRFSVATDSGKHKQVRFVNLTDKAVGSPTTSAEELAIYVKDVVVGAVTTPRLFYREPSNGTEQQLSGDVKVTPNGETTLPGGISVKWGTANAVGVGATAYTYVTSFGLTPYTTDTFFIATEDGAFIKASSLTKDGFSLARSTQNKKQNYKWMTIGI